MKRKRVVVTGLGVVASNGIGKDVNFLQRSIVLMDWELKFPFLAEHCIGGRAKKMIGFGI